MVVKVKLLRIKIGESLYSITPPPLESLSLRKIENLAGKISLSSMWSVNQVSVIATILKDKLYTKN